VVRVSSREQAKCAVEGILDGGIAIVEITLTVPNALSLIEELTYEFGQNLLVGAGTVLDVVMCRSAILAGAEFIVSPVFNSGVIEMARCYGRLSMPGALTPTEVLAAWQGGADFVKVFPCGALGGPSYIRSLKAPFPQIEYVVTGGANSSNLTEFLAAGATAVGIGEAIFVREALQKGDTATISARAQGLVAAVQSWKESNRSSTE
jgi:2-dehydro-3-deoxyphosphogluconate aldolase/(4S)-4-hydroxy-2-oxoglutarate aldolase